MRAAQVGAQSRLNCNARPGSATTRQAVHAAGMSSVFQGRCQPWLRLCSSALAQPVFGRSRCLLPPSAVAVATLPRELMDPARAAPTLAPPRAQTASQLLQDIVAHSTDWRYLQNLYEQHHTTMTTAHVAAIAMQLPRAVRPTADIVSDKVHGLYDEGLHGLYDEIMPRLEGQLHVLPARLLLGIASALDVCGMPCSSSWRAAFLSASAVLLSPPRSDAYPQGTTSPQSANSCSAQEVLSLARHVFVMYSGPGCSEEALTSAALTERLIAVTSAAAVAATQKPSADGQLQARLAAATEAAQGLLTGSGALIRPEAFPARIILQLLEALQGLQVKPPQPWLNACRAGLDVSARPAQMTAAVAVMKRLGWKEHDAALFTTTTMHQPETFGPSVLPLPAPSGSSLRQASHADASTSSPRTPSSNGTGKTRRKKRSKSPSPGAAAAAAAAGAELAVPRQLSPEQLTAPNSALEGMIGLLRDAASSGMLPELKATVFSQLEGCDPALVLWTAEAFHQLGSPLTSRELAQCVHLAASAVDAHDRGSDVAAWDVLALIQRCCNQGAAIPPGQLEHLLEYVAQKCDQLHPIQLADTLSAAAALVARSAPASSDAEGAAINMQSIDENHGGVSGKSVYAVMEALRPVLGSLAGEQAAKVAAALTALRACGVAAALPLPVWLNAYCTATQGTLDGLGAVQLRQVLGLISRSGHYATTAYLEAAITAARGILPNTPAQSPIPTQPTTEAAPQAGPAGTAAAAAGAAGTSSRGGSRLGDVLAVLELLVLDLGCEPSSQLAADVASKLVPALSAEAGALSPTELAGSLRLLAAMRCRPPAGAVQKLLGSLERYLFQLAPGRLALVAWACAELGAVPRRAFLSRYLEAAAEALPEMRPESLALLARSFAQLGIVPDASWQKAYRDAVLIKLPEADAETLSVLAHGLLHLGLRPDEAWIKAYLIESTFKLPEADAASVARCAHFMASCGTPPPGEWVLALMERTLAVSPDEFDPPDLLPLVLRSLVHLGWAPDPAWLSELLARIGERSFDLQPSSLIITATSLAKLQATSEEQMMDGVSGDEENYQYDSETSYATMDLLFEAASARLDEFTARELRWLLDPLELLPSYNMPQETADAIYAALATKEAKEQIMHEKRMGANGTGSAGAGMSNNGPEDEEVEEVEKCHESVAMGLNDLVSDGWLTAAVMV